MGKEPDSIGRIRQVFGTRLSIVKKAPELFRPAALAVFRQITGYESLTSGQHPNATSIDDYYFRLLGGSSLLVEIFADLVAKPGTTWEEMPRNRRLPDINGRYVYRGYERPSDLPSLWIQKFDVHPRKRSGKTNWSSTETVIQFVGVNHRLVQ